MLVRLVTPDLELLDAAIDDRSVLGQTLGCEVAEGWDVFPESLPPTRDAIAEDPQSKRRRARLFVLDEPRTLIGRGGFKGPPRDGVVELGYAVAPGWEGRGLATAAVRGLLREAFAAPDVQSVLAHTLAETGPSARVLEKTGFVREGEVPEDEVGTAWLPPGSCAPRPVRLTVSQRASGGSAADSRDVGDPRLRFRMKGVVITCGT